MSFSIIRPSRNAANLAPCIRAIRDAGETARIIVVDDGVDREQFGIEADDPFFVDGVKPFCFARNVNLGIRFAGGDDVILLNDDALLKTPMGFSALSEVIHRPWKTTGSLPEYDIIASTCNNVGNQNQWPQGLRTRVCAPASGPGGPWAVYRSRARVGRESGWCRAQCEPFVSCAGGVRRRDGRERGHTHIYIHENMRERERERES